MALDPKISRNAVIGLVVSVLPPPILGTYLFIVVRLLKDAFPKESLTNLQIYGPNVIDISTIFIMFVGALSLVGFGAGFDSIRRSRAQGSKPLPLLYSAFL